MKVYLDVETKMASMGMRRVEHALTRYAPEGVEIVKRNAQPDLHVLHAFSPDIPLNICASEYVVLQYCGQQDWGGLWTDAQLVWSYYDLAAPRFLRSPLGVDTDVFRMPIPDPLRRDIGVVTSGYVSGPAAEAIEEGAEAARQCGIFVFHLGPDGVAGMARRKERTWAAALGISDEMLAQRYAHSSWVSGLRRVEGFELPVIEGFACGARPIVFDYPDMRHWYNDFAEFVPETSGAELVEALKAIFIKGRRRVTQEERDAIVPRFNWKTIAETFWNRVLEG